MLEPASECRCVRLAEIEEAPVDGKWISLASPMHVSSISLDDVRMLKPNSLETNFSKHLCLGREWGCFFEAAKSFNLASVVPPSHPANKSVIFHLTTPGTVRPCCRGFFGLCHFFASPSHLSSCLSLFLSNCSTYKSSFCIRCYYRSEMKTELKVVVKVWVSKA